MTVKEFKASFEEYIKYLELEAKIKERIEYLYYELSGVKGIAYDKVPSSFNQGLNDERKLILIEMINTKQAELKYLQAKYHYFSLIIKKLDPEDLDLLFRLLIRKQSYESVAKEYDMSASALWKYVEKVIEEIL